MEKIERVLFIQLGILAIYTGFFAIDNQLYNILGVAMFMALHLFLSIVLGAFLLLNPNLKGYGKSILLSAAVVLVVGFSSCYLIFS
ncbi:MAG: hypothetical protein ACOVOO_02375 [Flavobacteriales bacterium]